MCAEPARAQVEMDAAGTPRSSSTTDGSYSSTCTHTFVDANAEMRAMLAHAATTARPHLRPLVVEATVGPLAFEHVLMLAARQSELRAPVKLTLSASGPSLLAEVVRAGDTASEVERVRRALAHGCAWVAGRALASSASDPAKVDTAAAIVAEACETLGWTPVGDGPGRYRVLGLEDTATPRLSIELTEITGETVVRVAAAPVVMRVAHASSALAIAVFVLRASARLRLVRLVACGPTAGVVRVERDVVLTGAANAARLAHDLLVARDALAAGAAESAGALRALKSPDVAAAFLATQYREGSIVQTADPVVGQYGRT